jgi:hypothetical protein
VSEDRQHLARFLRDELAAAEAEAPSFEEMAAYADGSLGIRERELFEARLADDALLREEVRDLIELRAAMQARSLRRARTIWSAALAASLLVVVLWRAQPAGEPTGGLPSDQIKPGAPVVAVVMDTGRQVGLAEDGHLSGIPGLSASLRDVVGGALRRGSVDPPQGMTILRPPSTTFMGGSAPPPALAVVSPVGVMVRSDRPLLRWTRLEGAKDYTVSILDQDLVQVTESAPLHETEWQPPAPLPRDQIYTWQVAARSAGGRVVAPQPPSPEARFRVLSAAEAAALDNAIRTASGSRLATGVLLARAGVLDEAEAEFVALAADNPRSPEARLLLESVRSSKAPGR